MAVVMRKRRIANPGRKRRRLSLKQLKFFGTKRQRAAAGLKLRKRRKNAGPRSVRKSKKRMRRAGYSSSAIIGVARGYRRLKSRRRRKNVGHILSFTMNPGRVSRKRRKVSMARRRRRNRKVYARRRRVNSYRRRRRNLFGFGGRRRRRVSRRRRHNPGVRRVSVRRRRRSVGRRHNPGFGRIGGMVTKAAYTIAGVVGTRLLTQAVLGSKNTGVIGYAGNAVAAFLLGTVTGKFLRNKEAASFITLGGFVGIVLRALQEFTPVGGYIKSQLQGMGDYSLGIYLPTTFFVPLGASSNADGNVMTMPSAVTALAAAKPKGMNGLAGSRYGAGASRYA